MSKKNIRKYDENNNLIYFRNSNNGTEIWYKYDENNNETHYKSTSGKEYWREYDKNNNEIHWNDTNNNEYWYKRDENNIPIEITEQEFKQIERTKLYFNNKKSNRFELMDI